jgi:hypothetical protein
MYTGFTIVTKEKVVDFGDFEITKDSHQAHTGNPMWPSE